MLPVGQVLQGRYTIEKALGQGGMGAVYLAREARLGKQVAVKQMLMGHRDPQMQARITAQFGREARILATLSHPGLVAVSDFFEEGGSQYLVMDYIAGETLDERLSKEPLTVATTLDWIEQICDVLQYLHMQQPPVIFRDLKPGNVMLDTTGRIRLIDFGIARVFEPDQRTATVVRGAGTAGFSPVEQLGNGTTDARSDIYALGATWYNLLTRQVPPMSVDIVAGEATLVPPSKLNSTITVAVDMVIVKMMGHRKEDRFQSITDLRVALRSLNPTTALVAQRYCEECGSTIVPGTRVCAGCRQPVVDYPARNTTGKLPAPAPAPTVAKPPPPPRRRNWAWVPVLGGLAAAAVAIPWLAPKYGLHLPSSLPKWPVAVVSASPTNEETAAPPTPTPVPTRKPVPKATPVPTVEVAVTETPEPTPTSHPHPLAVDGKAVVRSYLESLDQKDWDEAMRHASGKHNREHGRDSLQALYKTVVNITTSSLQQSPPANGKLVVKGVVDFSDENPKGVVTTRYHMQFSLVHEDGDWKVDDISNDAGTVVH